MSSNGNSHALVVVQLSGGNDCLNTVIPYSDGHYYDSRSTVRIESDKVSKLNDQLGLNPNMAPIKDLWDKGRVAIINGIGYPTPNRSHFRSMDIWHTAQPERIGTDGWLGSAVQELDPKHENPLTAVNFGRGLPRALARKGVTVTSVGGDLESYGLYPDLQDQSLREYALEAFTSMYGGVGKDAIIDSLGRTGAEALKAAAILRTAPGKYRSSVEYADNPIAQSLKHAAQVMFADLGARVYYTQHGSFDTHAGEMETHAKLWKEVSGAVSDFMDDLAEHGRQDDVVILLFSEFGRRIKDNGSGTDHGSGGVAFVIGGKVKGGLYGEYPSLELAEQLEGDLRFNNDFRSTYATILERWLGVESTPIVNGRFEQFDFIPA